MNAESQSNPPGGRTRQEDETYSSRYGFRVQLIRAHPDWDWVVMLPGAGATVAVWWRQRREFGQRFNLALVDLPGHTPQAQRGPRSRALTPYSFDGLIRDLAETTSRVGIQRCHVAALSLGTVLARGWARQFPERVQSLVLAGTIAELSPLVKVLMLGGRRLKHALPYLLMYRAYAWIIMPGRSHRRTRALFYRDARKLGQTEFNRWLDLSGEAITLLERLGAEPCRVPTLHVLGERDHMFKGPVLRLVARDAAQQVHVISGVGHACTIEAPAAFNRAALAFLERHATSSGSGAPVA